MPNAIRRRALRWGDTGADVRAWQTLLRAKGYAIDVDGVFGTKTYNATRVAQEWAGVATTGGVGVHTWTAVANKRRTRRPLSTLRHILRPRGMRPKIIDARAGRAGFPRHPRRRWGRRPPNALRYFVGHYTGGPGSFVADARFHVYSPYLSPGGAPAIAYAIGVDLDGTVFVFNDWNEVTWHCGWNIPTLGVAGRGGGAFTRPQRRSLKWVYRALQEGTFGFGYPRLALAGTVHRHVTPTSCPGPNEPFFRSLTSRYTARPRG